MTSRSPLAHVLLHRRQQKSSIYRRGGNAYNYMVPTARAKPHARLQVPAVIHADGSARLQIVREDTDAVAFAYLKVLGRQLGVEVVVQRRGTDRSKPGTGARYAAPRKRHGRRFHFFRRWARRGGLGQGTKERRRRTDPKMGC